MVDCYTLPVLVIDEDEDFRTALAENLRGDGHGVIECRKVEEALVAAQENPGASLVAGHMPGGSNGFETADAFWAGGGGSVILLTGCIDGPMDGRASRRPRLRLFAKPILYDHLHELVHGMAESA
jgi:DNA-binding NtrC family response regulator